MMMMTAGISDYNNYCCLTFNIYNKNFNNNSDNNDNSENNDNFNKNNNDNSDNNY